MISLAHEIINEFDQKHRKNLTATSKITTLNSTKPSPYSI